MGNSQFPQLHKVTGPITGQAKIAVTGTAVAFPSKLLTNGMVVFAKSTNTATTATVAGTVGGADVTNAADGTGNGTICEPGQGVPYAVTDSAEVYVNGTIGDVFSFAGS